MLSLYVIQCCIFDIKLVFVLQIKCILEEIYFHVYILYIGFSTLFCTKYLELLFSDCQLELFLTFLYKENK